MVGENWNQDSIDSGDVYDDVLEKNFNKLTALLQLRNKFTGHFLEQRLFFMIGPLWPSKVS